MRKVTAYRGNGDQACEHVPDSGGVPIVKVHACVPGRARFMVRALYRSESVKQCLEAGLRRIPGIKTVKGSVLTGKLLVVFARDRSADEISVLILQRLNADASATVIPRARPDSGRRTGPGDENAVAGVHGVPIGLVGPANLIYVPMSFLGSFTVGLFHMSPILIFLALSVVLMGQVVGRHEGWSREDALYFSFITATTVGYGDLRPTKTSSKALSVGIALVGMVFTGIVAAIGLNSAQHAFKSAQGLAKP